MAMRSQLCPTQVEPEALVMMLADAAVDEDEAVVAAVVVAAMEIAAVAAVVANAVTRKMCGCR